MIGILVQIANGVDNLPELALKTGLSRNRCSELAIEMERAHFLVRERPGMKMRLRLSDSPIAASFREMYLAKPYMKYLDFLYGTKLDLLQLLIYGPKGVSVLAKITNTSKATVRNNLRSLRYANLLWREKSKYLFAKKAHPSIYSFLNSLRTFTPENKRILWKFNEEELFRTRKKPMITELTGFNRYINFGVEVRTIDYFCIVPVRKLEKKEILAHSLLQIGDEPRLLGLAIAFYLKNHLESINLDFLISKYDLDGLFEEFIKTIRMLKAGEDRIENTKIPSITRSEIERILNMYGVKNV
ncbi:MAG: ArsR family transcriptional regulator [Nanoarchaeota archaeon]|nr:ArsR family transcriptional regulator [Nanoarchaeota archaeon]MBU1005646.1 ArsR family transcriptional regulator [Nanoarchaeota archaeon]